MTSGSARRQLLAQEKEFTRARDALSRARRELPWERVEKNYLFAGADAKQSLGDLFAGNSQLIVYHFMFDPNWEGRLQELLVLGRQLQRHRRAPEASRRHVACHFACPLQQARSLPEPNGVEF